MFGFGRDKPKPSAIRQFENDVQAAVIGARLASADRRAMISVLEDHIKGLRFQMATSHGSIARHPDGTPVDYAEIANRRMLHDQEVAKSKIVRWLRLFSDFYAVWCQAISEATENLTQSQTFTRR
jgi:hypothetical protein